MAKPFVLITGANGFIGSALCPLLRGSGLKIRAAARAYIPGLADEYVKIGEIGPYTDWKDSLKGVDVVIHLASKAHVTQDQKTNSLAEFRKVNVSGAKNLAENAVEHKVRRLIYISSVKVNGESTQFGPNGVCRRFSENDIPSPQDYYGITKWEAEQVLREIGKKSGIEIVILRPPLVYGPGVKANFLYLLKLIDSGIPLPFGSIRNLRSLIFLGNLNDIVLRCITDNHVAGQTFLISDGEDISTPELVRKIADAMGKRPALLPFPAMVLNCFGIFSGKLPEVKRITNSLCVDNTKIVKTLGWKAPYSLEQGINLAVESYKSC